MALNIASAGVGMVCSAVYMALCPSAPGRPTPQTSVPVGMASEYLRFTQSSRFHGLPELELPTQGSHSLSGKATWYWLSASVPTHPQLLLVSGPPCCCTLALRVCWSASILEPGSLSHAHFLAPQGTVHLPDRTPVLLPGSQPAVSL